KTEIHAAFLIADLLPAQRRPDPRMARPQPRGLDLLLSWSSSFSLDRLGDPQMVRESSRCVEVNPNPETLSPLRVVNFGKRVRCSACAAPAYQAILYRRDHRQWWRGPQRARSPSLRLAPWRGRCRSFRRE